MRIYGPSGEVNQRLDILENDRDSANSRLDALEQDDISVDSRLDNLETNKQDNLTFISGITNNSLEVSNDLITGKSGGQSIYGGTALSESLNIYPNKASTSAAGLGFLNLYSPINIHIPRNANDNTAIENGFYVDIQSPTADSHGSNIRFIAGQGRGDGKHGGHIYLTAGDTSYSYSPNSLGGNIYLYGGNAEAAGSVGGHVYITPGYGPSSVYGNTYIDAGKFLVGSTPPGLYKFEVKDTAAVISNFISNSVDASVILLTNTSPNPDSSWGIATAGSSHSLSAGSFYISDETNIAFRFVIDTLGNISFGNHFWSNDLSTVFKHLRFNDFSGIMASSGQVHLSAGLYCSEELAGNWKFTTENKPGSTLFIDGSTGDLVMESANDFLHAAGDNATQTEVFRVTASGTIKLNGVLFEGGTGAGVKYLNGIINSSGSTLSSNSEGGADVGEWTGAGPYTSTITHNFALTQAWNYNLTCSFLNGDSDHEQVIPAKVVATDGNNIIITSSTNSDMYISLTSSGI
jgi:hypothetical protein